MKSFSNRDMREKFGFGIIGCGGIGAVHAEALTQVPDAQLVAVADISAERARQLAATYGSTPYTDVMEMLSREQLNIVIVCTPNGEHGKYACQVMRSGRHVIVEKPMEISHAAIEEMLRVQQQTGVKLAVTSQHRFDPASIQMHNLVEEQAFGRLVLGTVTVPWWRSQAYYDDGWHGTWRFEGGGTLMTQALHSIDLLQWLMGPVKSIYGYTDTLVHRMETEDVAVAILRFANGALGTIAATTGAYPSVTTRIELFGEKGSAIIENDTLAYLHLARDEHEEVASSGAASGPKKQESNSGSIAQDPAALSMRSHVLQTADMIRAIREDGTPLVDGQAGRHPVEIILGIYESARTRKEVFLP
jgi:UDP-N-acetyl-2-amino-2-deoxyglucuronate dehydrogenase